MKKFIAVILFSFTLSFSTVKAAPQNTIPPLKEGVYEANNIISTLSDLHYVQNISKTDIAYFIVFNDDETLIQSIKLIPDSHKYELYPLDPSYRIVVIGKGSVLLS